MCREVVRRRGARSSSLDDRNLAILRDETGDGGLEHGLHVLGKYDPNNATEVGEEGAQNLWQICKGGAR